MHYMWDKPAMQVLIQAMRADTSILRKYGDHDCTFFEYQTVSSNAAHDAMIRYARRYTKTDDDAMLMLSVCSTHAKEEFSSPAIYSLLGFLLISLWVLYAAALYVLMPAAILLDIYIVYAANCKKWRLRRMWNHAKSSRLSDVMYNELISMEFSIQKPVLLCIPIETGIIFMLIAVYIACIRPLFI